MATVYALAYGNDVEGVREYIASGGDVDAANADGSIRWAVGATPLTIASLNGSYDVVRLLISEGANVNVRNGDCLTPLDAAASSGHVETMKLLIDAGADIGTVDDMNRWTPLFEAAGANELAALELLMQLGADVNATDKWGRTALIVAAERGFASIAEALINAGADVRIVIESHGISALERAEAGSEPNPEIAKMLRAAGATR